MDTIPALNAGPTGEGYGIFHHPNDSLKDGTLHDIAVKQLAQWEAIASKWDKVVTADGYARCHVCTQAVYRITDNHGRLYEIGQPEILACTVAHLRQNHPELQRIIDELDEKAD